MSNDRPTPKSRLAIFQFSCRTLLLATLIASAFFAWWSDREKVTKKFQRLEDELTMLRAALGNNIITSPILSYNSRTGAFGPPLYPVPGFRLATPKGTGTVTDDTIRDVLLKLFKEQQAWLSQNLKDNRDWREFIAANRDDQSFAFRRRHLGSSVAPVTRLAFPVIPGSRTKAKTPPGGDAPPKVDGLNYPVAKLFPIVRAMLRDGDSAVRNATMFSLEGLESRFTTFVTTLIRVLDDKKMITRLVAAGFISRTGATAKEALPRLKQLMNSSEAMDAVGAAYALVKIDPKFDVVPRMTELLTRSSNQVTFNVASFLMQLGPEKAASAVPTLFAMLNHKQAKVRVIATHAIGKLAPRDEAIDTLSDLVKQEKDQEVKTTMARIVLRLKAGVDAPFLNSDPDLPASDNGGSTTITGELPRGAQPGQVTLGGDDVGENLGASDRLAEPTAQQLKAAREAFAKLGATYEAIRNPQRNESAHAFRLPRTTTDAELKMLPNPPFPFTLNLYGTQVTDAGLKELKELKALIGLVLSNTKVTDAGLKELSRRATIMYPNWYWWNIATCASYGDAGCPCC